jgi:hypothetical protein
MNTFDQIAEVDWLLQSYSRYPVVMDRGLFDRRTYGFSRSFDFVRNRR